MALVTKPFTFSAGAVIVASEHNSNFDTLYNLVNGSLDNANISGSAAIVDTKLAQITTAGKVAASACDFLKSGDWLLSSVTTARTGFTNVSATYSNKFMRINATPLTTGGSDTVTLTTNELPAHTHTMTIDFDNSVSTGSNTLGGGNANNDSVVETSDSTGTGASFSIVPAFVQVVIFQRD